MTLNPSMSESLVESVINKGNLRFAALDGLRALAVVSVIAFHCDISGCLNAGFFGVDVFFAISGFIITAMLVKEYRDHGDIRFFAFYFRRLKRLLPPVLALLVLASLTGLISDTAFDAFRTDVPAALAYASNWWQILEKQAYFDNTPHVLKHLWSLAVEEQFYVVWPPIAYFSLKWYGPKTTGVLALLLACASTAWMYYLYSLNIDGADQNLIYLGTDTHAMGLLAGAALACFWNPWAQREENPVARRRWRLAACLSLAGLAYMFHALNPSVPAVYRGSFLLVPLLTGVVAYCTMNDRRFFLSRLLATDIVQWLGSRSYSLYLVHWLVFEWIRLLGHDDFARPEILAISLASVVALAELMYRCVEIPSKRFNSDDNRLMGGCVITYTFAVLLLFGWSMLHGKPAAVIASAPVAQSTATVAAPASAASSTIAVAAAPEPDEPADDEMIAGGEDIYAIGDSVLLGAKVHLLKTIPGIRVDAEVGRQASQGLKAIRQWRSKSGKASTILLHLGTNGYINEVQFKEILTELADRKSVIVINIHANRRWTAPNNEMIMRLTPEFPNVHVVNWNAVSASRPDYFVKDGIHLTLKGMHAFAAQIKSATGGAIIVPTKRDTMLASGNNPHSLSPARKTPEETDQHRYAHEPAQAAPPVADPPEKTVEPAITPPAADDANESAQAPIRQTPISQTSQTLRRQAGAHRTTVILARSATSIDGTQDGWTNQ